MSRFAEELIDRYIEATGGVARMGGSDLTPWRQEKKKTPKYKGGKPELENFGLAGLPGRTADWGSEPGFSKMVTVNKLTRR